MDYNARMREAKLLINQGMYTQAVSTLGNVLENLYSDFYQDVYNALPPAHQKLLAEREEEFTARGEKPYRDRGFAGLTLGGKGVFFFKNDIVGEAERILNTEFPHFKAFDSRLFISIRNKLTHEDAEVDEDEATLFYSQMRVLLLETGYLKKAETKQVVQTTGGLRSWKENGVIPHDDILQGNLAMDTYAADLWGVARKDSNTPAVYREADQFFQQTYLTTALEGILRDVLRVLSGGPGDRVLQLRTPFGGGKTHTLIALYHITKNRHLLNNNAMLRDLPDPGLCDVAAVQCEKFDVRKGRHTPEGIHIHTLWGEIAYQIAGAEAYEYLRESDENMTAPGGETIATLLHDAGHPVLILLDEVLNHVEAAQTVTIGDSTLGRQLMGFIKNLTEAVAASHNVALVYSLQASVREGLGAESLLTTLDHLVSRLDAKREPVSGGEVMRVVQRRLFKYLGDDSVAQQVAAAYSDGYRKARQAAGGLSGDEQYQAAQEAEQLAERILESYPFHPELLNLMYHRWGSLLSYQRTRGALQFLASVVYDLWEHGRDLQPLIGVGDIAFEQANTRNAFFTQVGQRENYTSVIDADLTGTNARAQRIDRAIATDSPALQRYRIGTRLATSVMLYSFGARDGEERGVPEVDLIQANMLPGLDRYSLTTALNDLRNELLYMHYTGRRYRFETQPNLNKLIDDETKKFDADDVRRKVLAILADALRGTQGAVIWPQDSSQVNDHIPMLQVVYLPLEWVSLSDEDAVVRRLSEWLEYSGNTRREYKNGLAFALPGYMAADSVFTAAREVLAIESLIHAKGRFKFNNEQLAELNNRSKEANTRLSRGILSLYEKVAVPVPTEETPYIWRFIELQSRNELQLHDRVIGALRDGRLVFDTLTPDKLIALTYLKDESVIDIGRIVGGFFAYLNFTRLTSSEALLNAISRGVAEGKMGYTAVVHVDDGEFVFPNKELIYFERLLRADEIDLADAVIIDAVLARKVIDIDSPPPPPPPPPTKPSETGTPQPGSPSQKKRYHLAANTDKPKIFKVFKVIQNLMDKSDRVTMHIEIQAATDDEFDPVWLRNAVEEPLDEADVDATISLT